MKQRFSRSERSTEKGRWNPYRAVIFGSVRHQEALMCRLCDSDESEKTLDRQILHHHHSGYKCFSALSDVL